MAVRIKPCFGCPIAKTDNVHCATLKATMKSRVSGLGLRTVIFDCPVLTASCAPGTRVVIPQKYMTIGYSYFGEEVPVVEKAEVPATILTTHPTGFTAVVDKAAFQSVIDEANEDSFRDKNLARFRRRMPFSRIKKFIPEPRREVCDLGNAKDENGQCDSASGCLCADTENQRSIGYA